MQKKRFDPEILTRGVVDVIDRAHLEERLKKGERLRIKLGIDPTSPNIHLGRVVQLLKLRDFQKLGHKIIFIVGDFTGEVGDTSDKESERPMLTSAQVRANMRTYLQQAGKILDIRKTEVKKNSTWLKKLTFRDVGKLADAFSVSDFIARTNIKTRLEAGKRVSLRETIYPLMQGYDSVAVRADLEIGGTDQKFNLLAGRTVQQLYGMSPQDIMTHELISGTDGRKMSSSWGNVIALTDTPEDMFGRVMSIPDMVMRAYFVSLTRVPMNEVDQLLGDASEGRANPRDVKMKLAEEIVSPIHGTLEAKKAREHFMRVFQKHEAPLTMPEADIAGKNIVEGLLVSGLVSSKSEARRLLAEGGIRVNEAITGPQTVLRSGDVVQRGKRHFVRVS